MNLLTEFFSEIRRFVPGLVVIALYYHDKVEKEFAVHSSISLVIPIACLLTIAWLLGMVLEEVTSCAVHFLWIWGGKAVFGWAQRFAKLKNPEQCEGLPFGTDELKTWRLRLEHLHFTTRQISRSLFFIFLFVTVNSALKSRGHNSIQPVPFSIFPWQWYFGPIGAVAFGFSWLWPKVREASRMPVNSEPVPQDPRPAHRRKELARGS